METWVEAYLRQITTQPDQVAVKRSEGARTVVLSVTLAEEDRGLFAGRNNRLLRALNHAAGFAGVQSRTRYVVALAD